MTNDERRMTRDELPRLTYSAIADNPEGGLAGRGGGGASRTGD